MADRRGAVSWQAAREPGAIRPFALEDEAGAWTVEGYVASGAAGGPTLALLAGIHGDEYEGPVAIAELLATLPLGELAGTLVAVPIANPPAFAAGTRTSPLDGLNLARCFPGDPFGQPSERLARRLTDEIIAPADAMIDLHSGGVAYAMATLVGYCNPGDASGRRSRDLALAFGAPVVWEHPAIAPGRTLSAAHDLGVPCIYTEAAGGGDAPTATVRCYVEGVRRVLVSLEMLPGGPVAPRHEAAWRGAGDTDRGLESPTDGLFRGGIAVGTTVATGQPLGEVVGYDGQVLARIVAPDAGIVAMVRRVPRVAAGDGLYLLTQPLTTA